jgi:acyl-CoA synthetase (AMP-forming)/AMP-acid ligase II
MLEKTAETITPDGWFRTGDVGYFDEEGYLYVTGRVDDMFTVGGFNIYPAEIENKLEQLPGISEAYIVPAPDRRLGNVPVAWVQLEDDADLPQGDIIVYCRQLMSPQKVPRRVIYYSHGELPLTPTGKLKKKELADITARRIKADQSVGEHLEKETQP